MPFAALYQEQPTKRRTGQPALEGGLLRLPFAALFQCNRSTGKPANRHRGRTASAAVGSLYQGQPANLRTGITATLFQENYPYSEIGIMVCVTTGGYGEQPLLFGWMFRGKRPKSQSSINARVSAVWSANCILRSSFFIDVCRLPLKRQINHSQCR